MFSITSCVLLSALAKKKKAKLSSKVSGSVGKIVPGFQERKHTRALSNGLLFLGIHVPAKRLMALRAKYSASSKFVESLLVGNSCYQQLVLSTTSSISLSGKLLVCVAFPSYVSRMKVNKLI